MRRTLPPGRWLTAIGCLAFLAAGACREVQDAWVWPPDTAALVEGQPITMTELNQVLGWGLYGQLTPEENAPATEAVPLLVLEKLIEERLVLAEAPRRKISLEALEKGISRPPEEGADSDLPPAQAESLRRNLLRQAVLHKITGRIMAEERQLSAADWRTFWRAWPKKKPIRYRVRALFLPPSPEAPALPGRGQGGLDQLTQRFKLEGFPVVLSAAVWLRSDRLDETLTATLETAWADKKLSPPVRQEGSWAVYEVLDLDRETAAVAELKAARAAYEFKAGEEAFRGWLSTRRATADIRINPSLTKPLE
ncbi:MAG: SurA N-terminal domain-containing protein [Candidatus Adiutrix sp.]|jgi:hypothetical protein|nr:SurA N-terminal domain-containing protein [Candidatus Adiutrix sp.]